MIGSINNRLFVFVHVSKTGGSSISEALSGYALPADQTGNNMFLWPIHHGHSKYYEYANCLGKNMRNAFTFSFARNPYDRLVSLYSYWRSVQTHPYNRSIDELAKSMEFGDWLKVAVSHKGMNRHLQDQAIWLLHEGNISINLLGRYETLQQDFETVCERLGITCKTLPHTNKTSHRHYQDYYNDESAALISRAYRLDLETFGYSL